MKFWTKLMAALAIAATVGAFNANAADPAAPAKPDKPAKAAKKAGLKGSVVKVDGNNVVISAGKKNDVKEVTVTTDDKTVVTIEGKPAKLADLKPGQKVVITPETGTAQTIDVPAGKVKKNAAK